MKRIHPAGLVRAAVVFGALVAFPFVFSANWIVNMAIFSLMYAGLATSWNLLGGYSGYVSLGHVAFFGMGAYAVAIMFQHGGIGSGYTPFLILPLVGIGAAIVSLPVAWVAFRTRASTFAIITLTFLFVIQQLAFNLHGLTNGSQGIGMAVPPFPVETYERPYYLAMLALFAAAMLCCWYVRGSTLGLMLAAIRDDEDRARGVGVRTGQAKLITFAMSVGLTAMIGGVWAYYLTFIYPQFAVDPLITIGAVLMVYLGGKGTLWGPALGAALLVPAQQYLADRLGASQLYLVGYATVFLAVMLVLPRGVIPSLGDRIAAFRRGRSSGTDGDVPAHPLEVGT
ncbi:MAG: branched-chain amino acid ABC transporter permease [Actinomycetota bacterium]